MCNRCAGLLVREKYFEYITNTVPAFKCVNCGNVVDAVITSNQQINKVQLSTTPRDKESTFSRAMSHYLYAIR
jgi:hypothetical protein